MNFYPNQSRKFQITSEIDDTRFSLRLTGAVDESGSEDLKTTLNAYLQSSHGPVEIDLRELESIDGSGFRAFADFARALESLNRTLILRSPTGAIQHILDVYGLASCIESNGESDESRGYLLAEPAVIRAGTPSSSRSLAIAPQDVPLLTAPLHLDALDAVLLLAVNLVKISMAPADGVSVSLFRDGQIQTVAASNQTVREMDSGQYATQEGPCVDASTLGHRFLCRSLEEERRWPKFVPLALSLGIRAIISNPLRAKSGAAGALNIYSLTPSVFGNAEQQLSFNFANEISAFLVRANARLSHAPSTDGIQGALESREAIALAQGILMERRNLDKEGAFDSLRRLSQDDDQTLLKHALDIAGSTRRTAKNIQRPIGGSNV